jgi:hypothetical protein
MSFSDCCHAEALRDTLLMANRIASALQSRGQTITEEAIVKYMLGDQAVDGCVGK